MVRQLLQISFVLVMTHGVCLFILAPPINAATMECEEKHIWSSYKKKVFAEQPSAVSGELNGRAKKDLVQKFKVHTGSKRGLIRIFYLKGQKKEQKVLLFFTKNECVTHATSITIELLDKLLRLSGEIAI